MDDDHTKVGKKAFPTKPSDGNRMNYENYDRLSIYDHRLVNNFCYVLYADE